MDELAVFTNADLFDPLFWTMLTATVIPVITALIVRYSATSATKSWVAAGLAVIDAFLVVWKQANDAGADINWKVLVMAIAVAITSQRVTYSQFVRTNKIPEKLPHGGLIG